MPNDEPACARPITTVAMVDIKDPTKPYLASIFPTPVPPRALHIQISAIRADGLDHTTRTSNTICLTSKSKAI